MEDRCRPHVSNIFGTVSSSSQIYVGADSFMRHTRRILLRLIPEGARYFSISLKVSRLFCSFAVAMTMPTNQYEDGEKQEKSNAAILLSY